MSATNEARIAEAILLSKGQGGRLPVSLSALTDDEWVDIQPLTTHRRFEGRLELCGGKPTIFVNDHGRGLDYPRARFTLAHELGHFFLHRRWLTAGAAFHDQDLLQSEDLRAVEREANAFAAGCLLPDRQVAQFLRGKVLSLDRVQELADVAVASLKATAIRVASLTPSRCCFFLEQGGIIHWSAASDDWRLGKYPYAGWKGKLPGNSHVAKDPGTFSERAIPIQAWCPNARAREEPLFESALQTSYGRLILVIDAADDSVLG